MVPPPGCQELSDVSTVAHEPLRRHGSRASGNGHGRTTAATKWAPSLGDAPRGVVRGRWSPQDIEVAPTLAASGLQSCTSTSECRRGKFCSATGPARAEVDQHRVVFLNALLPGAARKGATPAAYAREPVAAVPHDFAGLRPLKE